MYIETRIIISLHYITLNSPVLFKAKDSGLKMIRKKYSHLLPAPWWLIDPANPANNVYISGMSGQRKDKGWQEFARKVNSIDLTKDVQQQ